MLARAAWTERSFPTGLLLLGDRVGGHWRRTFERGGVRIDAHLYEDPTPAAVRAVDAVAKRFGRFVELTPTVERHPYLAPSRR